MKKLKPVNEIIIEKSLSTKYSIQTEKFDN